MKTTNPVIQIELRQEYARLGLSGEYSFRGAIDRVKEAIRSCREQRVRKLLVDVLGVRGVDAPTMIERIWMVEEIAEAVGGGALAIALVGHPELIDPQKFGALIAQNRGLELDVFQTTDEAGRWLAAL
jgi:hypothetical protein